MLGRDIILKILEATILQIYNHMSSSKKGVEDTNIKISLTKYLDLLRGGHLEQ